MSQLVATTKNQTTVLFGLDHALGWWLDEYKSLKDDLPILEMSTTFTRLSKGQLVQWLHDNLPDAERHRLRGAIGRIALDLDPVDETYGTLAV